jgi:hypothetical protein
VPREIWQSRNISAEKQLWKFAQKNDVDSPCMIFFPRK